jgi:hypothetical protein
MEPGLWQLGQLQQRVPIPSDQIRSTQRAATAVCENKSFWVGQTAYSASPCTENIHRLLRNTHLATGCFRLGLLKTELSLDFDKRPIHFNRTGAKVYVAPSECQRFTDSQPSRGKQCDQGSDFRVVCRDIQEMACLFAIQNPDLLSLNTGRIDGGSDVDPEKP